MDMLNNLFEKIGFCQKEAFIYTLLSQRGPNPASTLAKLSGINRASVYDLLKVLINKGLILTFQQGSTTYFAVDDPRKLYFDQKQKMDYAEQIIQDLKTLPQNSESLQINYYKGKEGYREMYEDILKNNPKELLGWLNLDNFYLGIDQKREEAWTEQRYKQGIRVRLILQDSKLVRNFKKEDSKLNRETRIIPKGKYPFDSSSFIYENYITFYYSNNNDFIGVRIAHPEFCKMIKMIFEMTWTMF